MTTQKVLWATSHNVCAFTLCVQPLVEDVQNGSGSVPVGEQAHIRSGRPSGPRHDPAYLDVDGLDNLILLCPTHHTLVDSNNGRNFTVAQLEQMKAQHARQQDKREKFTPAVLAYIADRYGAEDFVQFQQAELKAQVSALFVDVPLGCRADSKVAALVQRIAHAHPGDSPLPERGRKLLVAGAAQLLLHPDWNEDAVLVGGPGQGKSTILQYVAQYYRARRLEKGTYDTEDAALVRNAGLARIPIRLDLRRYAQWRHSQQERAGRDGEDPRDARTHLERYILSEIQRHTGAHEFSADDFELMLATEPVVVALDGLDEIPNVLDRDDVTVEIARARDRLRASAANLIVLVSTRPGSSLNKLTESGLFTVLQVLPLTRGLRRHYLERWIEVNALEAGPAERIASAYRGNEHLPHIEELASSPMQLAILLHLLHRRQLLPEQRTELFRNYLESFLDREQTEEKEPLLAQHRNVLVETHAYLGWYLHSRTEQGELQGGIGQEDLKRVLRRRLEDHPDAREIADALYSAITSRVLCLIEREGRFEFEVQSLREYFAAWHLFENLSSRGVGNSRDDGATALLSRGYWTNVTRFFLGMLTKGEIRSLHDNLIAANNFVAPHPLVRATTVLSLQDRVYQSQPTTVVEKAVAFVLDGSGVTLGESGLLDLTRIPLTFGERTGRAEAVTYLRSRLERGDGPLKAVASSLYRHAASTEDLAAWWWGRFTPTTAWLEVASSLQALRQLDAADTARLVDALGAALDDGVHIAPLLIDGDYEGDAEQVLRAVMDEQNRGIVVTTDRTTPVAVLSRIAGAIVSRRPSTLPRSNRDTPGTARARKAARDLLSPRSSEGIDALIPVANVWGGGWILSCAVGSVPSTVALDLVTPHASLNGALRAEHAFRSNAADSEWWRAAWDAATTDSERGLFVLGLLSHARQDVILASLSELEAAVSGMSATRYAAVFQALDSRHGVSRGRRLPLDEVVRTGLRASGPLLWLLRAISTEPTGWIDKRLAGQLATVVTAGIEPAELFEKVRPQKAVAIDAVRGATLEDLPLGVTVETLSMQRVNGIMSEPEAWPAQIVESAINALETRRGIQLKPLTQVAQESDWDVG